MSDLTGLLYPELDESIGSKPDAASWVDRLLAWLESLPGPTWLPYAGLTLAIAALGHAVRWIEGTLPLGSLDPARLAEAPLAFYMLALFHYLNQSARAALLNYRPVLDVEDAELRRLAHEITTLPRREAWLATGIGIAGAVGSVMGNPASWGVTEESSALFLAYVHLYASLIFVFGIAFLFHTVRQLRLVNQIHAMASNINLWQRLPVYAFSTLTARTGIGIVLMVYYYAFITYTLNLYGPVELSLFDAVGFSIFLLVASACFVLPLSGMRRKLTREKGRLVAEADQRFERTIARLHQMVDSEQYEAVEGLNRALASLLIEKEALAKIPTWPWRPETLRGFVSSIALPIILWLATTFLGQILGLR